MAGYLAAYKEVKAELRDRDTVIAELQEKLLPSSQPPTPAKTHGAPWRLNGASPSGVLTWLLSVDAGNTYRLLAGPWAGKDVDAC